MRVRMKTRAASPVLNGVLQPGQVVELPPEMAIAWLQCGAAEPVAPPGRETASVEAPEKAVSADSELSADHRGLTALAGLGAKTAAKLAAAGINSLNDLSLAEVGQVMQATGVKRIQAEAWIVQAMEG